MLAHMALRLAVIEALAPHAAISLMGTGGAPVWPTLARHRVLDSQIAAQVATEEEALTPLIAVFSDDGMTEAQGGGQDAEFEPQETVTLAIEIQVPLASINEDGQPVVSLAETDALAESFVNTIAHQIRSILRRARVDGPLRHVLIAIEKSNSRAWSDADSMIRLSARRLEMTCRIRADRDVIAGQTGLARLPSPLREVAQDLPEGSYGRDAALRVASMLNDPFAFAALQSLRLAANWLRSSGSTQPPPPSASDPLTADFSLGVDHAG